MRFPSSNQRSWTGVASSWACSVEVEAELVEVEASLVIMDYRKGYIASRQRASGVAKRQTGWDGIKEEK